jgi:glycosyltransferase involved in cell wall biosynthesis
MNAASTGARPMRLSIVIPTFDRRDLLAETLRYLAAQESVPGIDLEVVVADDGSRDGTVELVEDVRDRFPRLVLVRRTRRPEDRWCASRVRNLGLSACTGAAVVFLDCGMLVAPGFAARVAAEAPDQVGLIGRMVGLEGELADRDDLEGLSPATFDRTIAWLATRPRWREVREPVFARRGGDLSAEPAPWALGWTCVLSVPLERARATGGFDEGFIGWGSEDADFCYRLARSGLRFAAPDSVAALHLPHEVRPSAERKASNHANRVRLHRKEYRAETELFPYFTSDEYNDALAVLGSALEDIPDYHALLPALTTLCHGSDASLVVGPPLAWTTGCPTTHAFAVDLGGRWQAGSVVVAARFGCDTPHRDGTFELSIVTDLVRILPTAARRDLLREQRRVSRRVFLLVTEGFAPPRGRAPVDLATLRTQAGGLGCELQARGAAADHTLLELVEARAGV